MIRDQTIETLNTRDPFMSFSVRARDETETGDRTIISVDLHNGSEAWISRDLQTFKGTVTFWRESIPMLQRAVEAMESNLNRDHWGQEEVRKAVEDWKNRPRTDPPLCYTAKEPPPPERGGKRFHACGECGWGDDCTRRL